MIKHRQNKFVPSITSKQSFPSSFTEHFYFDESFDGTRRFIDIFLLILVVIIT